MEVTVRDVTGAVHMLDITPTMQLREMKSCVAGELGFADEAILLKYNGEVLVAEGQVVSDMGVAAGDEFEVSISTKGVARMRLKEAGEALTLSAARRLFSCGSSPDTAAAYMEAEIADRGWEKKRWVTCSYCWRRSTLKNAALGCVRRK